MLVSIRMIRTDFIIKLERSTSALAFLSIFMLIFLIKLNKKFWPTLVRQIQCRKDQMQVSIVDKDMV